MAGQRMRASARIAAAAVLLLVLGACGGKPTGGGGASATGCEVQPAGPGGPVQDPSGPYYHQVVAAHTTDGVTLTGARQVLDHASVPDGVRLADGRIYVYYVNGAQGSVWVASLEGDSATAIGPIALNDTTAPGGVVDPDAMLLADGSVRLTYLSGFGPPGGGQARAMCIAESSDGVRFRVVGRALAVGTGELATDPSLVRLASGSWLLAVSLGQQTILARSSDGLAFSRYDTLSVGGVPELAVAPTGDVRLYVCAQGVESHVSSDGGSTWRREGTVVAPGTGGKRIICDPSLIAGADRFLYKTAD